MRMVTPMLVLMLVPMHLECNALLRRDANDNIQSVSAAATAISNDTYCANANANANAALALHARTPSPGPVRFAHFSIHCTNDAFSPLRCCAWSSVMPFLKALPERLET